MSGRFPADSRVYGILTDPLVGYERLAAIMVESGVRVVQLRMKDRPRAEVIGTALKLRAVIPPEVRLKETAGRIPVRYVMLRSAGQRPFQVLSCASEPEGGASWVGVHQTGAGWTTLRVGPIVDPPDWTAATIRVTTDLPGFETIPIRVWLQR